MREQMHVRIVPMNADHLDEIAELERICFSTPWSRNMLAEELTTPSRPFWWRWTRRRMWWAMPGSR